MAVELQEGGYALHQGRSRKTVIQMKLTDSALRAIDCFEDNSKMRKREKLKIRFEGNQGIIQIPASERTESQNFNFQLSSLNQSAFIHCLQQHVTGRKMSVLGEMQQKITVNATDDSYNATKKRIEIAKELEKNISTKVIKQPSGSKIGKKQLLRRKVLDQKSSGSQFIHSRTSTPPPPRSNHTSSRSASPLIPTNRSVSPVSGGDLAGVRNKTKPILSSISSSKPSPAAGRPLQERILHYIALRPIKLQDLIIKLNRGNSSSVDKTMVQNILQQIALTRPARIGAAEYSLHKNFSHEIQPDWCGYNDDEKALIKRKLCENARFTADNRKRSNQAEPASASSPVYQNKREVEEETYSNPVKKKARVSLYTKTSPNPPRPRSVSPLESTPPISFESSSQILNSSSVVLLKDSDMNRLGLSPSKSSRKRSPKRPLSANSRAVKVIPNEMKRISPLTTSLLPPSDSFSAPSPFDTVKSDEYLSQKSPSGLPTSNSNEKVRKASDEEKKLSRNTSNNKPAMDITELKNPLNDDLQRDLTRSTDEFIEKYKPINYAEQRDRYKNDFSAEYKEYLALHQKVVSQCKRFGEWQQELSQQERSTDTYKKIARKVYAEYMRLKEDKKFHEERERRDYLHRKLKYIKKLVLEFDSRQFAKHDGPRQRGSDREPHHRPNDVTQKRAVLTA